MKARIVEVSVAPDWRHYKPTDVYYLCLKMSSQRGLLLLRHPRKSAASATEDALNAQAGPSTATTGSTKADEKRKSSAEENF